MGAKITEMLLAILSVCSDRELEEASTTSSDKDAERARALAEAGRRLDAALGLAGSEVDLSTRLDSRIMMLRDEIAAKREMLEM